MDTTYESSSRVAGEGDKQAIGEQPKKQQQRNYISSRSNKIFKQQLALGNAALARIMIAITVLSISLAIVSSPGVLAAANEVSAGGASQAQQVGADEPRALDQDLNSIVQRHEPLDGNNKQLAEAIISRFMLDNLTGASLSSLKNELMDNDIASDLSGDLLLSQYGQQQPPATMDEIANPYAVTGPDALRSKKLLSLWQNYGSSLGSGLNAGQAMIPFPELPASEVATMKRTVNYLQQHQQRQHYGPRNSFDFGLGKRPDSGLKTSVLRFGDVATLGGQPQAVGQFGKRPSAHRYDFGLGKRVASVSSSGGSLFIELCKLLTNQLTNLLPSTTSLPIRDTILAWASERPTG